MPPLPEWDKDTYPYAAMFGEYSTLTGEFTGVTLRCSSAVLACEVAQYNDDGSVKTYFYDAGGDGLGSNDGLDFYISIGDSEWGEPEETSYTDIYSKGAIWTNTTIFNKDGTVHLAAPEPVPVYE